MIDFFKTSYQLNLDEVMWSLLQALVVYYPDRGAETPRYKNAINRPEMIHNIQVEIAEALRVYCLYICLADKSRQGVDANMVSILGIFIIFSIAISCNDCVTNNFSLLMTLA